MLVSKREAAGGVGLTSIAELTMAAAAPVSWSCEAGGGETSIAEPPEVPALDEGGAGDERFRERAAFFAATAAATRTRTRLVSFIASLLLQT